MEPYDIAVGDSVFIWGVGSKNRSLGVVEKIGSKLVHISEGGFRTTAYYRDTQERRDGYPGRFRTALQVVNAERRDAAVVTLRDHGIDFYWARSGNWSADQLVALVEAVQAIHPDATGR